MNLNALFVIAVDRFPPWLAAVLLIAAALSFLARHRAQFLYGRIREYQMGALMAAVALMGMGLFYGLYQTGAIPTDALRGGIRVLLAVTAAALVYFNWGGVRVAVNDARRAVRQRRRS